MAPHAEDEILMIATFGIAFNEEIFVIFKKLKPLKYLRRYLLIHQIMNCCVEPHSVILKILKFTVWKVFLFMSNVIEQLKITILIIR